MPIPTARVAWYVTGQFYEDEQGRLQDLGYFLYLAGVEGGLFSGDAIGESTALLTFRSEPFQSQVIRNGDISIGLDAVGKFSIYRNPGGATFTDPDSFSSGERVAVFQRVGVEMGQTLSSPHPGGFALSTNVFSADLVESVPFEIRGFRYDFRELLPHGFHAMGHGQRQLAGRLPAVQADRGVHRLGDRGGLRWRRSENSSSQGFRKAGAPR